jgi:hypothetical protein
MIQSYNGHATIEFFQKVTMVCIGYARGVAGDSVHRSTVYSEVCIQTVGQKDKIAYTKRKAILCQEFKQLYANFTAIIK